MKEVMNMTEKKMTKREYINRILTYAHDEDKAYLEHELELLDKKNSAERKPTPKQTENAGFKSDILDWAEAGVQYTAGDFVKGVPSIVEAGISVNRVTAMLTQLVNDGAFVKTVDKRKSYYSLAE
jgi:hypothetical protein